MKKRAFGRTGLMVSELVYGGGAVGGLLINADDDTKTKAIRRAIEGGINWIDTAASYGDGQSEKALGWLLKEIKQDMAYEPYLSTKFAIDTSDRRDLESQIEASVTASFERLQCSSVTLMQLHNAIGSTSEGRTLAAYDVLKSGGVLDVLEKFRSQGMFSHIGFTALGQTSSIIEVINSGRMESAQVYYNLTNPSAGRELPSAWPGYRFNGVLDACYAQKMAVMGIRILSAGVLATNERHGREAPLTSGDTLSSETSKAHRMFDAIGESYGTRAQTAIRFALSESRLSCAIIGLAELWQLDQALAGQNMGALDNEALDRISSVYESWDQSADQDDIPG